MIRNIMFLLVLLACFTRCAQVKSKSKEPLENDPKQHQGLQGSILIENDTWRGISYTDSMGSNYNLRYIPITITNDNTIPVHLQISFSKEYHYPYPDSIERFKLVTLPKEWALEGVEVTEKMIDELAKYIDKPLLNETIKPSEKYVIAIGTLYPKPPKFSGVLPGTLVTQDKIDLYSNCDRLTDQFNSIDSGLTLGLSINSGETCKIIPCGHVSFFKH